MINETIYNQTRELLERNGGMPLSTWHRSETREQIMYDTDK